MIKNFVLCIALAAASALASAQSAAAMMRVAPASAPADSASAPVSHKWAKMVKGHKPAASAVDPERSPDKKGGQ